MKCSIAECGRVSKARGWCGAHWTRWSRHGDPLGGEQPISHEHIAARFWSKVLFTEHCWLWGAADDGHGYGVFGVGGKRVAKAHRWAYEFCVGPIPEGMQLDHLCRNRACVNPDHLEPVTNRENTVRGTAPIKNSQRLSARIGVAWSLYCKIGHRRTAATVYFNHRGSAQCKPCALEGSRRRRHTSTSLSSDSLRHVAEPATTSA